MKRWFAVAAALACAACGPTVASRGVMGVGWMRSASPPADHGIEAFAEYLSEIGGTRVHADDCAMSGVFATGASLGVRDQPQLDRQSEPLGVLRYDAEVALLLGGGAMLRCGHFGARVQLQVSPFAFGGYQSAQFNPAFDGNSHPSSDAAFRLALVVDALAIVKPPFRTGLRFTVERREDWSGNGTQYAFSLGVVFDWGNRPPGAN